MKRFLMYAVPNSVFAASIYLGLFGGSVGFERLAYFMAWFAAFAGLAFLTKDRLSILKLMRKYPVPAWFDGLFDAAVLASFVWVGAWITSVAYAFHIIMIQTALQEAAEDRAKRC